MKNIAISIFVFLAFFLSGCTDVKPENQADGKQEPTKQEPTRKGAMGSGKIKTFPLGQSQGGL